MAFSVNSWHYIRLSDHGSWPRGPVRPPWAEGAPGPDPGKVNFLDQQSTKFYKILNQQAGCLRGRHHHAPTGLHLRCSALHIVFTKPNIVALNLVGLTIPTICANGKRLTLDSIIQVVGIPLIENKIPPARCLEGHQAARIMKLSCVLVFFMLFAAKLSLQALCCNAV